MCVCVRERARKHMHIQKFVKNTLERITSFSEGNEVKHHDDLQERVKFINTEISAGNTRTLIIYMNKMCATAHVYVCMCARARIYSFV